jgi:hypothetical protein
MKRALAVLLLATGLYAAPSQAQVINDSFDVNITLTPVSMPPPATSGLHTPPARPAR